MEKNKNVEKLPSPDDIKKFEMLRPMLVSDLAELRELSKKKQDEPLNKFKVDRINKKLAQIKDILKAEPANEFLDLLDDNLLPTNSDAVFIVSQYKSAMEQYKQKYYTEDSKAAFGFEDMNAQYSWKTKE